MTLRDLIPPRRLEPVGVLFLYTVAAGLILSAELNPLALTEILRPLSWVGALGLLALPWTTSSRQRAVAAGVVAFVLLSRIAALFYTGRPTGATLYGAIFWAVLLTLTRDQDQAFRQKLNEGPQP